MKYVPGRTLDICWPQLSLQCKLMVVWTLRGCVRQLRNVPLPHTDQGARPGPLGDEPAVCEGTLCTDCVCVSVFELTHWI